MSNQNVEWHITRSWGKDVFMDTCGCMPAACGDHVVYGSNPSCKQHSEGTYNTIRGSHYLTNCKGT